MFRQAVVQLAPVKGDIRANLAKLGQALQAIATRSPDLVVLPEAALTGYFLQGGVRELALTQNELLEALNQVYRQNWEGPLDLVVGFFEREGATYFNSAAYIELGGAGTIHVHRKVFLPTYGVFDEERFLSRSHRIQAFDTRFGRSAILICEDFWHSISATLAALDGAEILYVPSASPARGFSAEEPANVMRWKALAQTVAAEHGIYVSVASLAGFEGGKGMSGGSVIAGPAGNLLGEAPLFEPAVLWGEIDLERIPPIRYDSPLLSDLKAGLALLLPDLRRVSE